MTNLIALYLSVPTDGTSIKDYYDQLVHGNRLVRLKVCLSLNGELKLMTGLPFRGSKCLGFRSLDQHC